MIKAAKNAVPHSISPTGRFWRISTAGISFQGGAAAIDSATIKGVLVNILTDTTAVAVRKGDRRKGVRQIRGSSQCPLYPLN
jgi:hypothetical protein